ncbi:MAG: PA2779 family protein [Betaproteobacteria bacterium]|nr:PA2779 family protein [Betaproteobacteria bacterium]MBV9361871.1 PA2779 family protein [Betaproteobacteria bacterium]
MIWTPYQMASAGMIATDRTVASSDDRAALNAFLARADVATQLQTLGIDAATAKARVAALSDAEARTLANQVGDAPAGGVYSAGIIAVILIALVAWAIYKERNPW